MGIGITLCLSIMPILTLPIVSAWADEPTWLFTIPKAECLGKDQYNIGFVYADFGIAENLELGIHGLKYAMPGSDFALGVSLIPMASPYIVASYGVGRQKGKLHLGIKAAPYIFFAGFETPISNKAKFIAEFTNGMSAGVRIFPSQKWTLDVFMGFITVEVYRYNYGFGRFYPVPGILFAYSGKL